jgi:hypothetical protein
MTDLSGIDESVFDGKPAATDPAPAAAAPAQTPEPAAQPQGEDGGVQPTAEGMMPYGAYKSEREKRKAEAEARAAAEKKAAALEARLALFEKASAPRPAGLPDPLEDPDAFTNTLEQRLARQAREQSLQMSEFLVSQQHGAELVKQATEAAFEAMQANPYLAERFRTAQSPHAEAVKWWKEQQALQTIGEDPAAYRERLRAELLAEMGQAPAQAATAAVIPNTAPVIPPSLAGRVSVGSTPRTMSQKDVDDQLFGR